MMTMTMTRGLAAVLILTALSACAPADRRAAEPDTSKQEAASRKDVSPPSAQPVADIDPNTGLDRNVTYEPQLGPEPRERSRNDAGKSAPRDQ